MGRTVRSRFWRCGRYRAPARPDPRPMFVPKTDDSMPPPSSKQFVALLEPIRDSLYRYAKRAAWKDGDVGDIVQEAFMTAWRQIDRFELGTNFRAWMFQILVNTVYRFNKRLKRQREVLLDEAMMDLNATMTREETWSVLLDTPDQLEQILDERLVRGLRKLGGDERQCLLLRLLEGFSYKEIAAMRNIPLGTVMSHVHRARMKLREELAALAAEHGLTREATQ